MPRACLNLGAPKRNLGRNMGLVSATALDQAKPDSVRRSYAKALARVSGSSDPRLEQAYHRVHREEFLPPGPWKLLVEGQFVATPNADPAHVYQNAAIALDIRKGINNGEPHLHAMWIGAAAPQPGETVTQIGLGKRYYSAILLLLVLPGGCLIGFEIDGDLAVIARRNLSDYENASVVTGDATSLEVPPSDLIYVSAAVVEPPEQWLTKMRPGGRLIFPWRPTVDVALAMLVKRAAAGFEARPLMSGSYPVRKRRVTKAGCWLPIHPRLCALGRFISHACERPMTAPLQSTSIAGSQVQRLASSSLILQ